MTVSVTVTVTGGGHSDVLVVVMVEYVVVGGEVPVGPVGNAGVVLLEIG